MTGCAPVAETARRLCDRALSWLHAHRELDTLPSTSDLGDPDSVYKPLGETTLAASLVVRDGTAGPGRRAAARSLLDFTWAQMRGGDLLYERLLQHTLLTDPAETYAHFVRAGYRHPRLDELLAHQVRLRSVRAVELIPDRKLAVANAHRIIGLDDDADWDALIRATWLGGLPEPWAIDWMTAYQMTHTVFHSTDWGALPYRLPADLTAYLHDWLPVWIDIWREIRQWDLVAELLVVGACLEEPYCDPDDWRALAEIQHEDGFVPRDGDPIDENPVQRFKDHQHTVVVTAVAGTIAAARASAGRS
ncbi:hypothetical protein SAMN04489712_111247 [Thermomonospora echinospora]|uniref:DUF6895 domain-containing protein n=1 Tax=Thermomonospora echinospora TaxID=1992 RepID=A0A1H6CVN5_9ACTN|nr:hypothetical protein [Thermomonospora echinospora]SEG77091.1 hypothetical protein SAMN04489712_111247 [Thermomonospora echinospora]